MFMKCRVGSIWLSLLYADDVRFYMLNEFELCLVYWSLSKGEDHLDLFLYIYQLFFYVRCSSLCLFKHAQSTWNTLQAKWTVCFSLSSTNSVTPRRSTLATTLRGRTHLLGLQNQPACCFYLNQLLLSVSFDFLTNVEYHSDWSFIFEKGKKKATKKEKIPMVDFHVNVLSKLCLWLSLFVFD